MHSIKYNWDKTSQNNRQRLRSVIKKIILYHISSSMSSTERKKLLNRSSKSFKHGKKSKSLKWINSKKRRDKHETIMRRRDHEIVVAQLLRDLFLMSDGECSFFLPLFPLPQTSFSTYYPTIHCRAGSKCLALHRTSCSKAPFLSHFSTTLYVVLLSLFSSHLTHKTHQFSSYIRRAKNGTEEKKVLFLLMPLTLGLVLWASSSGEEKKHTKEEEKKLCLLFSSAAAASAASHIYRVRYSLLHDEKSVKQQVSASCACDRKEKSKHIKRQLKLRLLSLSDIWSDVNGSAAKLWEKYENKPEWSDRQSCWIWNRKIDRIRSKKIKYIHYAIESHLEISRASVNCEHSKTSLKFIIIMFSAVVVTVSFSILLRRKRGWIYKKKQLQQTSFKEIWAEDVDENVEWAIKRTEECPWVPTYKQRENRKKKKVVEVKIKPTRAFKQMDRAEAWHQTAQSFSLIVLVALCVCLCVLTITIGPHREPCGHSQAQSSVRKRKKREPESHR